MYSAGDTSAYYIKTWFDLHDVINWAALGLEGSEERLPLTPAKIAAVGAATKKAGYSGSEEIYDCTQAISHVSRLGVE